MTKLFNFALKIKGVVGRVAEAKSSDPATPKNLERALGARRVKLFSFCRGFPFLEMSGLCQTLSIAETTP